MSRCILDNEETGVEVAVGWDPGLGTFFSQVIHPDEERPSIWRGTTHEEVTEEDALLAILHEVAPYACAFNVALLLRALLEDRRSGDDRLYDPDDLET